MTDTASAVLALEDGTLFRGTAFGATGQTLGEAVFCTAMTGYQETLTDPSYHRQIVVAAAPQIGNTGWNDEDGESRDGHIWVAGYAVRDPARRASNWRADRSLESELMRQNIVGIAGIDTRTVVRRLRTEGSMKAGIFSGRAAEAAAGELVAAVTGQRSMLGADLAREVSTGSRYVVEPDGGHRHTVVAVDLGVKTSSVRMLVERGARVHVVAADTTPDEVEALEPNGVFLSNGPGDPATADPAVRLTEEILGREIPVFGICFGNQILGRALGRKTYKMPFGHRGINIPVIEHGTGRVSITAHNHGFAVQGEAGEVFDTPFGRAEISHVCANDGVVEGVRLCNGRACAVQYHPEAAAGPHDAAVLFDRFTDVLDSVRPRRAQRREV